MSKKRVGKYLTEEIEWVVAATVGAFAGIDLNNVVAGYINSEIAAS